MCLKNTNASDSQNDQDHKDKYIHTSRKILLQDMIIFAYESSETQYGKGINKILVFQK